MLASASERRHRLLAEAGVRYEIRPSHAEEVLEPGWDGEHAARELAALKARAVARELDPELAAAGERRFVLGADTVVAVPLGEAGGAAGSERLLAKPEDPAEALEMLTLLSGSRHRVVTGVAVAAVPGGELLVDAEVTWVTMRPLSPAERQAYVDTGEWRGKAGGYAIQETADAFVTALEGGGFDNVVGLPVPLTLSLLRSAGAPGIP